MTTNDAILELLLALDWTRYTEVCDVTPEELEEMENHGEFARDGHDVFGVGQTDTSGNTYAFKNACDDGNILMAPYAAGTIWGPEEKRYQEALRALAAAVFQKVPDSYCQSVAFQL